MVVECPECGATELLEEQLPEDSPRFEVECSKCGHRFLVRAAAQRPEGRTEPKKPPAVEHTGQTTVVEVRTRLPEGKKVALVAMKGPAKGSIFPITKPEVILGRTEADIVIPDMQVSGRHCTLEVRETVGILRDLGSTNGIYVGTERVKTARLEHLSEFRIGSSTLMFTVTAVE